MPSRRPDPSEPNVTPRDDSAAAPEGAAPGGEETLIDVDAEEVAVDDPRPSDSDAGRPCTPREKVRQFPTSPGVYLMKDAQGRVIYVGKARNLRSRAGSYFLAPAAVDRRTAELVPAIADADCIPTDSEVDALLLEARLIKDIQPRFNQDLKDDKTFPYLQIVTGEDFPRVEFTRTPRTKGQAVWAVHLREEAAGDDRGVAEDLPVPQLLAGHRRRRRTLAMVSAMPAGEHQPVHGSLQPADLTGRLQGRHPAAEDVSGWEEGQFAEGVAGRDASGGG
ncbi:MAG: hypothetical protein R3B90_06130 [Planctomycetaceae bacterium]